MINLYWCEECDTRLSDVELGEGEGVLVTGRAWCENHRKLAHKVSADADTLHGVAPTAPPAKSSRRARSTAAGPSQSSKPSSPGARIVVGAGAAAAVGVLVLILVGGGESDAPPARKRAPPSPAPKNRPAPTKQPEVAQHPNETPPLRKPDPSAAAPAPDDDIILIQPRDRTVKPGENVMLICTSLEQDARYQWQRDGQAIPGATSSRYGVTGVTSEDDGAVFRCVVSSRKGRQVSDEARLTVTPAAPAKALAAAPPAKAANAPAGTAAAAPVLVTNGLVAYWPLDEKAGTIAHDTSGRGMTGTLAGGLAASAWGEGRVGGALRIKPGQYVRLNVQGVDFAQAFSVAAWVRYEKFERGSPAFLSKNLNGQDFAFVLLVDRHVLCIYVKKGGKQDGHSHPDRFDQGKWHHVAAVIDASNRVTLYLDGVASPPRQLGHRNNAGELRLGQPPDPYWGGFNGWVDDVHVFNRAITPAEVQALHRRTETAILTVAAPTDGLVGHWALDEESGSRAADASGRGHHGRLLGTAQWRPTGGRIGGALDVDGKSGYVAIGLQDDLKFSKAMTIAAWIQVRRYVLWSGVAGWLHDTGRVESGYILNLNRKGGIEFGLATQGGKMVYLGDTGHPLNQWIHVAGVYDGSRQMLYIDGVLKQSRAESRPIDWNPPGNDGFEIGRYHDDNESLHFDGLIDDVFLYNRALSAPEIQALFTPTREPTAPLVDLDAPVALLETHLREGRMDLAKTKLQEELDEAKNPKLVAALKAALRVADAFAQRDADLRAAFQDLMGKKIAVGTAKGMRRGVLSAVSDAGLSLKVEVRINGKVQGSHTYKVAWTDLTPAERAKRRKDAEAANDDERVADALAAIGVGDIARARQLLAAAKDHPLAAPLAKRVGKAQSAEAEAAAKKAWETFERRYKRTRKSRANAPRLLKDLAAFQQAHGKTQWAAAKQADIEKMVATLNTITGASLLRGLVGYWPFDEGKGTTSADRTGKGNNAVLKGATWAKGRFGNAVEMKGKTDFIEIPDHVDLRFGPKAKSGGDLTVSLWVKKTKRNRAPGILLCKDVNKISGNYTLRANPKNQFGFFWNNTGEKGQWGGQVKQGKWQHVVALMDADDPKGPWCKLYVDGTLVFDKKENPQRRPKSFGGPLVLGGTGRPDKDEWTFYGVFDDLRIYNRHLTEREIKLLGALDRLPAR